MPRDTPTCSDINISVSLDPRGMSPSSIASRSLSAAWASVLRFCTFFTENAEPESISAPNCEPARWFLETTGERRSEGPHEFHPSGLALRPDGRDAANSAAVDSQHNMPCPG